MLSYTFINSHSQVSDPGPMDPLVLYHVYKAPLHEHMLNRSASLAIQNAFSKPYLVNLISKYTHPVFAIQETGGTL